MDNIAIVDDEEMFVEIVSEKISMFYVDIISYPSKINTFTSSLEFFKKLKEGEKYDICFLDIEMPGMSGVNLAAEIRKYYQSTYIIFITSHPDYALSGYKLKIFDYVLKSSLLLSLYPILRDIHDERMRDIGRYLEIDNEYKIEVVDFEDIMYIYREDRCSVFMLQNGKKVTSRESLDKIHNKLNSDEFVIIAKGYILNIKYFRCLRYNKEITLKDGTVLELGKTYTDQLRYAVHCYYRDRIH